MTIPGHTTSLKGPSVSAGASHGGSLASADGIGIAPASRRGSSGSGALRKKAGAAVRSADAVSSVSASLHRYKRSDVEDEDDSSSDREFTVPLIHSAAERIALNDSSSSGDAL